MPVLFEENLAGAEELINTEPPSGPYVVNIAKIAPMEKNPDRIRVDVTFAGPGAFEGTQRSEFISVPAAIEEGRKRNFVKALWARLMVSAGVPKADLDKGTTKVMTEALVGRPAYINYTAGDRIKGSDTQYGKLEFITKEQYLKLLESKSTTTVPGATLPNGVKADGAAASLGF